VLSSVVAKPGHCNKAAVAAPTNCHSKGVGGCRLSHVVDVDVDFDVSIAFGHAVFAFFWVIADTTMG